MIDVIILGALIFTVLAAAAWALKRYYDNDELDWIVHKDDSQYARFQRLVKKYHRPGYVYATSIADGWFGIVAEDLNGKVIHQNDDVIKGGQFYTDRLMADEVVRFMDTLRNKETSNNDNRKDYI